MLNKLEQEKAVNKCLQIMFSSVSHEFRTPLNAFMNASALMKTSFDEFCRSINREERKLYNGSMNKGFLQSKGSCKLVENFNKFYKISYASSSILLYLVEDILDLAKIEAGTFTLNIQPFKLKELMEEMYDIFEFQ
mmetsp:Transcript_2156/g.1923  ORF Transcript_2156/g.1923 Transcript_2156/m.1923 type:complete len:136 (-) Transcript_2156:607-1014(-)